MNELMHFPMKHALLCSSIDQGREGGGRIGTGFYLSRLGYEEPIADNAMAG
jgi:hypothetical protein